MSALPDTAPAFPSVACFTVGWWTPPGKTVGTLALPYAYPASEACLAKGRTPNRWGADSLHSVLIRRHRRDTWYQAVHWPDREDWERLAKSILFDEGRDPSTGLAYVVVDLDRPDHNKNPWGSAEEAEAAVWETAHRLGCSVHATRGGLRAVWVLERLIPLEFAQSYLNQFHARLPSDLPVDPDKGVKDWTRAFRVPWSPRADGKVAPWEGEAPPMFLEPMLDGEVLRWNESELQNENLVRLTPYDWQMVDTSDRNTKRIGGWFKAQIESLQAAPSRHAALIAKARALGGLCVGAMELARNPGAVDPEPFLQALIAATDTTNAERTGRQALDYGAAEPWWFDIDEEYQVSKTPPKSVRSHLQVATPLDGDNTPPDDIYEDVTLDEEGEEPELPPELDDRCLELPYTDLGNARRLAFQFGCDARWCQTKEGWLLWQGSHWDWDMRMGALGFAQQTVDRILFEAKEWKQHAANEGDPDRKANLEKRTQRAFKHYISSQSSGRISAILAQAKGLPGIPVATDDFDTDPWLLTVENYTIDLQTQTPREHRRSDLINRVAPVIFDPEAKCPTWIRFIDEVFPEKVVPGVAQFVQRAIGYSLTGDISEQLWFLLQGEGSNGKSTLLDVIGALLGAYTTTLPKGFLEAKEIEPHPTERVGLYRARFASGTEPRSKKAWDAEGIKRQTGGDIIEARFMHGDFFYFYPTHKLWVACNDIPKTDDSSNGFWRRVVIIPFTQRWYREDEEGTPKVDPELSGKLKEELPGILNWALQGLKDKIEKGLRIPTVCRLAVNEYRKEQDEVGRFLIECCDVSTTSMDTRGVAGSVLYAAYRKWRDGQGLDGRAMSNVAFGKSLSARKIEASESGGRTRRKGITLKAEPTEDGGDE